jgi:hypothetical protein
MPITEINKIHSDDINKMLVTLVNKFNSICNRIGNLLITEFPREKKFYIYNKLVLEIIEKNASEPISKFLLNIWSNSMYKQSIIDGDESFFAYGQHESLTCNDSSKLDAMFQFRECWTKLNDKAKRDIKGWMKQLIETCDDYVTCKNELLERKKITSYVKKYD